MSEIDMTMTVAGNDGFPILEINSGGGIEFISDYFYSDVHRLLSEMNPKTDAEIKEYVTLSAMAELYTHNATD